MIPAKYDFTIVRGTSATAREYSPLVMRFLKDTVPIEYTDVRLSIFLKADNDAKGTLLLRTSMQDGGLVETDAPSKELSWFITTEQSRLLPVDKDIFYEVEVRTTVGSEAVFMRGKITAIGGLNDDDSGDSDAS